MWCEHLQFSYGNMRSCNDGRHLYGGYAQYVYLELGNFVDCGEASMTRESMKVVIDPWME